MAQSCPPASDPGSVGCYCPIGSFCGSTQCTLAVNGSYLFPVTCSDCNCVLGLLLFPLILAWAYLIQCTEPTVHNVYSPTWGSVWYTNTLYTIKWSSTNLPFVEILLLIRDSTGALAIVTSISSNTTNSGTYNWLIPASTVGLTEGYYVTVRPVGAGLASLDGFSRSPVFSISPQPSGLCQAGYFSSTGSWPGCTQCPQGTYVSRNFNFVNIFKTFYSPQPLACVPALLAPRTTQPLAWDPRSLLSATYPCVCSYIASTCHDLTCCSLAPGLLYFLPGYLPRVLRVRQLFHHGCHLVCHSMSARLRLQLIPLQVSFCHK